MSELWVAHHAVGSWQSPSMWTAYLEEAQNILGSPLTNLDVEDPVRRKSPSLADAGNYICDFSAGENSKWVFGRFGKLGIDLSIHSHCQLDGQPNTMMWHVPIKFASDAAGLSKIQKLFDVGNAHLVPFYAYSDNVEFISSKKSRFGSIDIQAELLGIFWLTYFDRHYVAFWGEDKFVDLPFARRDDRGGITLLLSQNPEMVAGELREEVARRIGKSSFVDPHSLIGKRRGEFALTFQKLINS